MREIRSFTYNGTVKPDWLYIIKTHRPMFTPSEPKTLAVPGRPGVYHFGNERGYKEISFDVLIMATDDNDLWLKIEWLTGWLDQGTKKPLVLNDEPGRYYQAIFISDAQDLEQFASMGTGTIRFLVPEYKYGQRYSFDIRNITTPISITNRGTAPFHPYYTVTFRNTTNFFSLISPDGFIMYGKPAEVTQIIVPELENVLYDEMDDLALWSASGVVMDYGVQSGSFYVDRGAQFAVQDYGDTDTNKTEWHGPILKRSLPAPLQDFRVVFEARLSSGIKETSRICLWLLSSTGNIVGRIIIWDRYMASEMNTVHATVGPAQDFTEIIATHGPRKGAYNNAFIRVRLRRKGMRWSVTVNKVDSAGRDLVNTEMYARVETSKYQAPISQVQIGTQKYGTTPGASYADIRMLKVQRVNEPRDERNETPAIFQPGDRLEIDSEKGAGWLNGEYFNQYLDPGSRFFSIEPGVTEIVAETDTQATATMQLDYIERYK